MRKTRHSMRAIQCLIITTMVCPWSMMPSVLAEETPEKASKDAPAKAEKAEKPEKKPDFPPFDEVTEGYVRTDGFFDLYHHKKKDHLLAAVPKSMLGKDFLILTSIAGGPGLAGFMWDSHVARWEMMDDKLVLFEPDLRYAPAKKATVADVVARTYTDTILLSAKIVTKRGGDPVVDFDKIWKSDRAGLGSVFGGSVNRSLSRWAKIKGFDRNIELAVDTAVMKPRNGGGTRARVHYSISELPKSDYKPRQADPRVGYFMTAIKDWSKSHDEKTVFDRFVHRWHLKKSDPKAAVSDVHPDHQIIFYIEKTVPIKYRRYVRAGILEWNKAFEKVGLLNAVECRQQTDTNEFADLDPEDVRYNFFRWIVSGRAFAMGPSRVNPRTGQILDADILWDDALVRSMLTQYARLSARGPAAGYDPQLHEFLDRHPEWAFEPAESQLTPNSVQHAGVDLSWEPDVLDELYRRNQFMCNCAQGMTHEMSLANLAFKADGFEGLSDEFIGQAIQYVVAHEVGHTLGLRHNFKGSSWKPLTDIESARGDDATTCASVMDYVPPVYGPTTDDQPRFYSSGIGPYDYWAIEYGYRPTDDEYKSEDELLSAVTARCNEPGLDYATDEDTMFFAPDPMVNRYDNGDDPIKYAKSRMTLIKRLQSNLADWSVEDGESYSHMRRSLDALLFEYNRVSQFASRVVGGQYVNRNHKGDANERPPFVIVPVEKQREAIDFIVENIFAAGAFDLDPAILSKLAPGRWRHWESDNYESMTPYPVHDRIMAIQYWALFNMLNPFTISRVHDAEIKVDPSEDALTVPEIMTRTTRAIWSELTGAVNGTYSDRSPLVSSLRRNLQRQHLEMMLNIVLSQPGQTFPADARSVARTAIKGISQQIEITLGASKNIDTATKAHLEQARARIEKALDAKFTRRS